MNENLIQQIQPLLQEVASKLGTSATQVWHWAIRQQYIDLAEGIFILPFLSWGLWFIGKKLKEIISGNDYEDKGFHIAGLIFAMLLLIVITITIFYGCIDIIFNPQYQALKDILSTLRSAQ